MNFKNLRHELRLIYLAFTKYGRGFSYLYMRFIVGWRIIGHKKALSKSANVQGVSAHFLTGARDFTMSLWALASFYRYSSFIPHFYFHTDGTLNAHHKSVIKRLFPHVTYIDGADVDIDYAPVLLKYPSFLEFKRKFPGFQSKKLIDTYIVSSEPYRFIFDSDMLWFKDPVELSDAYKGNRQIMMDGAGGLCPQKFTDGTQTNDVISNLNSGIVGFAVKSFSLGKFTDYLSRLDLSYTHHFVEQAAFATCLQDVTPLPSDSYIIKGELTPEIVMRHYTSPSRAKFFFYGLNFIWKDILK